MKERKKWRRRGFLFRKTAEGTGILLAAGYLFYDKAVAGLIFFPFIFWYVKNGMKKYDKRCRDKTAAEFKDCMQIVVSALTAGYSVENAFRESLEEIGMIYGKNSDGYLNFLMIVNQLNLNISIEKAFQKYAEESNVEEINNFAQVLTYAKQSGGNLISIIKDAENSISEKIDVKREISTIISAKKLEQNIMSVVPVVIILYMRLTSAGMFDRLYGTQTGIIVMTVCLIVYFVAVFIAGRIVDIDI